MCAIRRLYCVSCNLEGVEADAVRVRASANAEQGLASLAFA